MQERLFTKVCRRLDYPHVCVSQFSRFGKSGAHLFLIYFDRKPTGIPYLLKVARFDKARKEYEAIKLLHDDVPDARVLGGQIFEAKDLDGVKWGALLYDHHGAASPTGAANPLALREALFDSQKLPIDELRTILTLVFRGIEKAHLKCKPEKVQLANHFEEYFREHGARARIRCCLGRDAESDEAEFLGATILNPVKFFDSLPRHGTLCVGLAHGDLHPDNVIIDQNGIPHLVDFAWGARRDVLLDFTLLENSIRFMAFPRPVNFDDQLAVDQKLLEQNGYDEVPPANLRSADRYEAYTRLACMVKAIRGAAISALGTQFSMQRYLLTQFLVLYGLLSFDDYEPYVTTRALGLIAKRLREHAPLPFLSDTLQGWEASLSLRQSPNACAKMTHVFRPYFVPAICTRLFRC